MNFEKSRDLIKEATSLKKIDIIKAISLIEQAIEICPHSIIEDKLKLSSYYYVAGNKDKGYDILFSLLSEINLVSEITARNMQRMQVYEKLCILCYSDKKYFDYIYYYTLERYNTNLAVYTMGRKSDYYNNLDTFDKFGTSYSTKIVSCFKKLNKESIINEFSKKFDEFFQIHNKDLMFILEKSHKAMWQQEPDFTRAESVGERAERILRSDNEFKVIYSKYTDEYFINYFNQTLKHLIE